MTDESLKTSNDLIRWLKLLALPVGVKATLALIMLLILLSALGLLGWGLKPAQTQEGRRGIP